MTRRQLKVNQSKDEMASVPWLELKGITKRFKEVTAVDNISFQVDKGEFFSLLGPSGCGKTTTLRMVGGLEAPDEGEIIINGEVVNDLPAYRRDTSIVFQNLALFPHLTVNENIAFGLECRKVPKPEIGDRVAEVLNLVRLQGMGDRRIDQLSGGQQQRVALARSIVLQPEVLLLDEPLASLDRKLREDMQLELKQIQERVDITFIYVTHDQKEAISMSDRIAVMNEGRIIQLGAPTEIYERPRARFVADFMGASNIFAARVVSSDGDRIQTQTEGGLTVSVRPRAGEPTDGGQVSVCIRPEEIKVLPPDAEGGGPNSFSGIIEEMVYQGDFTELVIALENGEKNIVRLNSDSARELRGILHRGEEVLVEWPPEDVALLEN
jgi:spermidine/putrescine transport system ATP-binding protein